MIGGVVFFFLTQQSFMSLFSPLVPQGRSSVLPIFATSLGSGLLTRMKRASWEQQTRVFIVSAAAIGPLIQTVALSLSPGH